MKLKKAFILIFILILNNCISNFESSNKFRKVDSKFRKDKKFIKAHLKSSTNVLDRFTSQKFLNSKFLLRKSMVRAREVITAVVLVVSLVLKIGNAVMSHFINKMKQETLEIMNKMKEQNTETLIKMRGREIESCATIKLIIQSNRQFFLLSKFKSIYFFYYKERLNEADFPQLLNEENKKILQLVKNTIDDMIEVREKLDLVENDLLESLDDIEKDLCSQESSYDEFKKKNSELDAKIEEIENTLEKKEDNYFSNLFSGAWSGIKDFFLQTFELKDDANDDSDDTSHKNEEEPNDKENEDDNNIDDHDKELLGDLFGDLSNLVINGFNNIINKVKKLVFQKIEKEIVGIIKNIKIQDLANGNFAAIKFDEIKNSAKKLGDVFHSGVNNLMKNAKDQVVKNLQNQMSGLIDENLQDFVQDLKTKINPDQIKNTLQKMGKDLSSGIDGIQNDLRNKIFDNLTGQMSELIDINLENVLDVEVKDLSLEGIKNSFGGLQNSIESKIHVFTNKVTKTVSQKISNFIGVNLSIGEMNKKFRADMNQIKNTIKKFGVDLDLGPKYAKLFDQFKITDNLFEGVGIIIFKIIGFIGSISSLLNKIPKKFVSMLKIKLGSYYELVINLFNLGVAGVKWYLTPEMSDEYTVAKDSFWKIGLKLAFSLAKLCIPGFSGIATESVSFFKKVGDLFTAYKKKKQQTIEMNFFKTLADLKIKEQENTNKFKICLANLITMKSQYSTILEMSEKDEFFYKNMAENSNEQSIIGEAINPSNLQNAEFYKSKGIKIFKREVMKICNLNIQFCSRYLKKKLLEDLEFSNNEINDLIYLSTNGPYTDIVVSQDPETSVSFIKLGYEPIAENLYGCRMCTKNYMIRHIRIIPDDEDKNIQLEKTNLLQGKLSNGNSINQTVYKDTTVNKDYSEFIQQRLDPNNYLIYEIIHPNANDGPKIVLSRLLYYPLKYPDNTAIRNRIPAIQAELSVWDLKKSKYVECTKNYPNCDSLSLDDHSIIINSPMTLENNDNLNILSHNQHDKNKSTSNLSYVPVGGIEDNYNSDFFLDKSNFLYFVHNKNNHSEQEVHFIKKNNSGKGSIKFSLSSNVKLLPNEYNWIVRESTIPSELIRNELGSFIEENSLTKLHINRKSSNIHPSNSSNNRNHALEFYLIHFEPFSIKENVEIKEQKVEMDCRSVCDESDGSSKSANCVSSKMRFNDYIKIQEINGKILSIENIQPKNFKLLNHPTLRINKSIDWKDKNIFSTTLEEFSIEGNFVYKKIILYDYDEDDLRSGTEKEINSQINEIKNSNRRKYMLIQKMFSLDGKRIRDRLNFKILSKTELDNIGSINTTYFRGIRIKLDDINDEIILLRVRTDGGQKEYMKELSQKLKGYTILHQLIIRDYGYVLTNNDYLFVLVNPNPSSQHIPAIDNISTEFFSFKSDEKCIKTLYQSIEEDFSIKDTKNRSIDPIMLQFTDFNSDKSPLIFSFEFEEFASINFTKLMFRKMFPNKVADLNPFNLFKYPGRDSNGIFDQCSEINFMIPFYFPISKEQKANNLYRTLHINESNSIQHVISKKGPGIKGIYWLLISSFENETEFSKGIIDKVRESGYSFFKKIEWVYFSKRMLYVTIYVQYDYRLKIDKDEICNLCMQVKQKMLNAPQENKVDMNAIIKSYKK